MQGQRRCPDEILPIAFNELPPELIARIIDAQSALDRIFELEGAGLAGRIIKIPADVVAIILGIGLEGGRVIATTLAIDASPFTYVPVGEAGEAGKIKIAVGVVKRAANELHHPRFNKAHVAI